MINKRTIGLRFILCLLIFSAMFSIAEAKSLFLPRKVAVNKAGEIYILCGRGTWKYELRKYNSEGEYINSVNDKTLNLWPSDFRNGLNENRLKLLRDYLKEQRIDKLIEKIVYPQNLMFGLGDEIYIEGKDLGAISGIFAVLDPTDGHTIAVHRIMTTEEARKRSPKDIAVDNEGNVYITNFPDYPVKKFSKNGKFIKNIGKWGFGNGEFKQPHGIAVDKRTGDIYVTDMYAPGVKTGWKANLSVQKFDKKGKFLKKWGGELFKINSWRYPITFGSQNTIEFPIDIAVDSDGYVYVLERSGPRISKFDGNGRLQLRWGQKGSGQGEFDSPEGICVDDDNNVYVADTGNNRVQEFDSGGRFLREIK